MTGSTTQVRYCEACDAKLCGRGPAKTGLCFRCRQDGAAFAAGWAQALLDAGHSTAETADIVGYPNADVVRSRVSHARRRAELRPREAHRA
jgi:hypothetical protein